MMLAEGNQQSEPDFLRISAQKIKVIAPTNKMKILLYNQIREQVSHVSYVH